MSAISWSSSETIATAGLLSSWVTLAMSWRSLYAVPGGATRTVRMLSSVRPSAPWMWRPGFIDLAGMWAISSNLRAISSAVPKLAPAPTTRMLRTPRNMSAMVRQRLSTVSNMSAMSRGVSSSVRFRPVVVVRARVAQPAELEGEIDRRGDARRVVERVGAAGVEAARGQDAGIGRLDDRAALDARERQRVGTPRPAIARGRDRVDGAAAARVRDREHPRVVERRRVAQEGLRVVVPAGDARRTGRRPRWPPAPRTARCPSRGRRCP